MNAYSAAGSVGGSAAGQSREVEILLCCTRAACGADETAAIGQLVTQDIDWDGLIREAEAHKVVPLLCRAKWPQGALPPSVATRLEALVQSNARRSLLLTTELLRILRLMQENGIPAIPIKGPALAAMAYGDLALRQYLDLDILVQHRDMEKALAILTNDRYALTPALTAEQLQYELHSEFQHHLELYGARGGVQIELHWRFMPERFFFTPDLDPIWNRRIQQSMAGSMVSSLSVEDLIIFLCVHGRKHHWSQLSWVADLAGLVRHATIDWSLLLRYAEETAAKRRVLLGFGLAKHLLHTPLPEILEREMQRDRSLDQLIAGAEHTLFSHQLPGPARLGPYRHALETSDGASHSAQILYTFVRKIGRVNAEDFAWVRLPKSLFFLYYAIHPVRLLVGVVSRAWTERAQRSS